jgi:putative Mg2+ transporter-C (MgtC) family protein
MELSPAAEWLDWTPWVRPELALRLLLAAILGGLVGLERELSGKPAGFRTNLLICLGAALLTELSISVARAADPAVTIADPGRIAAQIVSGIGFLGAGTIIQARGSVVGLTTAATLWVVAAIGMAVGAGAYFEAVATTVLVILVLMLLGQVETRLIRARAESAVQLTVGPDPSLVTAVQNTLEAAGLNVELLSLEKGAESYVVSFAISGPSGDRSRVFRRLLENPDVRSIKKQ